jgi:transposase InsO family protein
MIAVEMSAEGGPTAIARSPAAGAFARLPALGLLSSASARASSNVPAPTRAALGLVHHSDRGSPYASDDYRAALRAAGVIASMSRKGDCYDNAVAESFFATLRAELLDHESYATRNDAESSIQDYLDNFYNPVRRHSFIGYVSPIELN